MIVGIEMAHCDRASFHTWYPEHVESVLKLVDHLHVRVADEVPVRYLDHPNITWEYQNPKTGRFFDEAAERQELLTFALDSGAEWAVCFDSDEVIHSGWEEMANFMERRHSILWGVNLSYCSHHRPGYVLATSGFTPWRGFRLTDVAKSFRYQGDADGLHCGSVVPFATGRAVLHEPKVLHHHACTVDEYLQERAFYSDTSEVEAHGGIDVLYPICGEPPYECDRFGREKEAIPLEQWLNPPESE